MTDIEWKTLSREIKQNCNYHLLLFFIKRYVNNINTPFLYNKPQEFIKHFPKKAVKEWFDYEMSEYKKRINKI